MTSALDHFTTESLEDQELLDELSAGTDDSLTGEPEPQPTGRSRKRRITLIAAAAVVALLTIGGGTVAALAKTVTIQVDGVSQQVTTLSGSVEGALAAADIEVGANDALSPSLETSVSDGSVIVLDRGRLVTVSLDGDLQEHWTTERTVAEALTEMGHDPADLQLSHAAGTAVPLDGIKLTASTLYDVAVTGPDGKKLSFTTTELTVAELLKAEGITLGVNDRLSVPGGTALKDGLAVSIRTLPTVSLVDGAAAPLAGASELATVGDLLKEKNIVLGAEDILSVDPSTPLSEGLVVAITRVQTTTSVADEPIAEPAAQTVEDKTLARGVTQVTQEGQGGIQEVSRQVVTTNGVAGEPVELSRVTKVEALPKITKIGTKAPVVQVAAAPPAAAAPAADPAAPAPAPSGGASYYDDPANWSVNWDRIAKCESTNNWSINTGNGYFGGLQFDRRTWLGAGGGVYGDTANLATKSQQIEIAEKVYAARGMSPWACK